MQEDMNIAMMEDIRTGVNIMANWKAASSDPVQDSGLRNWQDCTLNYKNTCRIVYVKEFTRVDIQWKNSYFDTEDPEKISQASN